MKCGRLAEGAWGARRRRAEEAQRPRRPEAWQVGECGVGVGGVEHGTVAEDDRDQITPILPGHGKVLGLALFAMGSHSFRVGERPDGKYVFQSRVRGRVDCREEEQSREARGSRLDAGSRWFNGCRIGMCPPTPSQQEQVSGVPRLFSAEANAGAWARNDGSLGGHGGSGDGEKQVEEAGRR